MELGENNGNEDQSLGKKRISSSSEEEDLGNINDALQEKVISESGSQRTQEEQILYECFLDCRLKEQQESMRSSKISKFTEEMGEDLTTPKELAAECSRQMIKQAEKNRAQLMEVPGMLLSPHINNLVDRNAKNIQELCHLVMVDED